MTKDEKIKYILLNEIHEECMSRGINYFVLDHDLLCLDKGISVFSSEVDICMRYFDFQQIQRELRGKKYRTIESIFNNHNMPCVYFRYVYTRSLAYRPEYHKVRKAMGISINIHIMRKDEPSSEKLYRAELEMSRGIESIENSSITLKLAHRVFPKTVMFAIKMDYMLRKEALVDFKGNSWIFIPEAGRFSFPMSFFEEMAVVKVAGREFCTVKDIKDYLKIRYGENYKDVPVVDMKSHYRVILDQGIKYSRIIPFLKRDKIFSNEFWNRRNRFIHTWINSFVKMEIKEKEIYSYFYCEEARFRLWKQYYWQRDDLLSLYSQGRFDELWMRFRNYNVEVMRGIKQGYVPIFDDELYELYRKLCSEYLSSELQERIDQVLLDRPIPELDGERIGEYYTADMCRNAYKTRCI